MYVGNKIEIPKGHDWQELWLTAQNVQHFPLYSEYFPTLQSDSCVFICTYNHSNVYMGTQYCQCYVKRKEWYVIKEMMCNKMLHMGEWNTQVEEDHQKRSTQ